LHPLESAALSRRTPEAKIQVMPTSFVVQAEKDGQVVTLVINSDGKTVHYLQEAQPNPMSQPSSGESKKEVDKALGNE
jgi:hypothetical protein